MSKGKRRWLVDAIRKHLLPALQEHGFDIVRLTDEENRGEIKQAYPFGRLRRSRDGCFDLAEIVMDKYGDPAFKIVVGTVTASGILHSAVGRVAANDVWASHLEAGYGIYQVPWLMRKFQLVRWPWQAVTEQDFDEMVAKISKFIPREIDEALVISRIGPHVRRWG